jgi:hypothetical protein
LAPRVAPTDWLEMVLIVPGSDPEFSSTASC